MQFKRWQKSNYSGKCSMNSGVCGNLGGNLNRKLTILTPSLMTGGKVVNFGVELHYHRLNWVRPPEHVDKWWGRGVTEGTLCQAGQTKNWKQNRANQPKDKDKDKPYTGCFLFNWPPLKVLSTKKLIQARLGVSRTIYVNVDTPNQGFTYFNFLGGAS